MEKKVDRRVIKTRRQLKKRTCSADEGKKRESDHSQRVGRRSGYQSFHILPSFLKTFRTF